MQKGGVWPSWELAELEIQRSGACLDPLDPFSPPDTRGGADRTWPSPLPLIQANEGLTEQLMHRLTMRQKKAGEGWWWHPLPPPHPPCSTVPLFPFLLPGEVPAPSAQMCPAHPALSPGPAAELGCDFSPCGVNAARGWEGRISPYQTHPQGSPCPQCSHRQAGHSCGAPVVPPRCPGGDAPLAPLCGPSFPLPAVPLSPPVLLLPISLLPHQPWPLCISLFFFSSPFA